MITLYIPLTEESVQGFHNVNWKSKCILLIILKLFTDKEDVRMRITSAWLKTGLSGRVNTVINIKS